jgi:ribosomal protein S18 acetylase RimI-like enzyme
MTPSDAVGQNMLEFFRHFARSHRGGEVVDLDGISIASAGMAFYMFNAAFLSKPVPDAGGDLERRIDQAAGYLGGDGRRWAFWVAEDKLENSLIRKAKSVFHRRDLRFAYRHPGMINESLAPPGRPLPPLEIRRVASRQERIEFSHINSVAFRIPLDWCLELYDADSLSDGAFTGFVGYANGEAVSTAAAMVAAGAVGVYAVATLPQHERRGYAEAMTRHALAWGQQTSGFRRSVLQSTDAGLPLYRRLGYQVVTHFTVFCT